MQQYPFVKICYIGLLAGGLKAPSSESEERRLGRHITTHCWEHWEGGEDNYIVHPPPYILRYNSIQR